MKRNRNPIGGRSCSGQHDVGVRFFVFSDHRLVSEKLVFYGGFEGCQGFYVSIIRHEVKDKSRNITQSTVVVYGISSQGLNVTETLRGSQCLSRHCRCRRPSSLCVCPCGVTPPSISANKRTELSPPPIAAFAVASPSSDGQTHIGRRAAACRGRKHWRDHRQLASLRRLI